MSMSMSLHPRAWRRRRRARARGLVLRTRTHPPAVMAHDADSVITLYSDCLSPFSYFAFTVIDRYVKAGLWPAKLVLKPILLGGVMAATGNLPPGACVHHCQD